MPSRSTKRVAIVDDNPVVARSYSRAFISLGYEPILFTDPRVAIAELAEAAPDLVVMDIGLDGDLTGFDIAKALPRSFDVPILFLTGLDDLEIPALELRSIYAYLPKPVRTTVLQTTVRLLEMQYRGHKQLADLQWLLAESQRIARIGSFRIDGDECSWTDFMYELHGVERTSHHPTVESSLALIVPEDREGFRRVLADDGRERMTFEYRVLVDGQLRQLRGQAERRRTEDRMVLVGTVQDVTESERAVEANRAKTEFLANMSHELRTPLNAVLGLSESLLEGTFGAVSPVQRNVLGTVHASGSHLLELINDVLDISRVELGNLTIAPVALNLRSLVDEVADLMAPQLAQKRQRFIVDIAPDVSTVEIDRRRFKQVLLNLVGNAGKFSPEESIITLAASSNVVQRQLTISVTDQGPGILEQDRQRVFQPFVTLDATMTRRHGGVGLGLSLARRIVELHRGTIVATEPPGGGCSFVVTLPLAGPTVLHHTAETSRRLPAMEGVVVLLAEDNEAISFAIASYLESLGCTVRLARDGSSALHQATDEIDAIIMDVQLPHIDGLTVTRQIRARGQQRVPIIVVTAHAMPGDDVSCLEAGGSAYLAKPVSLRRLAETLETLVEAA